MARFINFPSGAGSESEYIETLSGLISGKYSSQRKAAKAMGINHSYLSKILKGKRKPGRKFINGILREFKDLKYEEIFIKSREG